METKMPCIDCICFAICKGQNISHVLYKCNILEKYMRSSFYNFDMGCAVIEGTTLPKREDYQ